MCQVGVTNPAQSERSGLGRESSDGMRREEERRGGEVACSTDLLGCVRPGQGLFFKATPAGAAPAEVVLPQGNWSSTRILRGPLVINQWEEETPTKGQEEHYEYGTESFRNLLRSMVFPKTRTL